MHAGHITRRYPRQGAVALLLVLAGLVPALWAGAPATAAPPANPVEVAAVPGVVPRTDGSVRWIDFPRTPAGGALARSFVHTRSLCGDAFCTIQGLPDVYRVFGLSGCDTFDLYHFTGLWDAHNHGSLTVHFLDAGDRVIGRYAGGRSSNVDWTPVYAVRTCN